jgi:hypothetical protein
MAQRRFGRFLGQRRGNDFSRAGARFGARLALPPLEDLVHGSARVALHMPKKLLAGLLGAKSRGLLQAGAQFLRLCTLGRLARPQGILARREALLLILKRRFFLRHELGAKPQVLFPAREGFLLCEELIAALPDVFEHALARLLKRRLPLLLHPRLEGLPFLRGAAALLFHEAAITGQRVALLEPAARIPHAQVGHGEQHRKARTDYKCFRHRSILLIVDSAMARLPVQALGRESRTPRGGIEDPRSAEQSGR